MLNFAEDNIYITEELPYGDVDVMVTTPIFLLSNPFGKDMTRTNRTFTNFQVIPFFVEFEEGSFEREARELDMIFTFGFGDNVPRKKPLEVVYKNKKMAQDISSLANNGGTT
mgnify:FL=1